MSVIQAFLDGTRDHPGTLAFVSEGGQLTYSELGEMTESIASAMHSSGLETGTKVAVYTPNHITAFACVVAVLRAEGVWVPVNWRNSIDANAAWLDVTDCEWIFFHSDLEKQVAALKPRCPKLKHFICIDGPCGGDPSLEQFAQARSVPPPPDPSPNPDRLCTIFATGGTTGLSKGAMWTDRVWDAMIETFRTVAPRDDHLVHLCVAPMTHAAGVLALMMMGLKATHIVIPNADPLAILRAIENHRVTHLYLPPTLLYMLLAHPQVREFDYSSLDCFVIAAAPVAPDKLQEAIEIFGPVVAEAYGQAEAPFLCTFLPPEIMAASASGDHPERLQSCGRATSLMNVEIMDDKGSLLGTDCRGEIVVRGDLQMAGYYKNEEATADITEEGGWRRTGDVGFRDKDGFFYIIDRKKDMIITGGFNVFSAEVEQVILSHPAVQDCAVIGVPDDKWGEAVKACVELKPNHSVGGDELIHLCKAKLGSVNTPKTIEFWPSLPRSSVGKILKRDIRESFWSNKTRRV